MQIFLKDFAETFQSAYLEKYTFQCHFFWNLRQKFGRNIPISFSMLQRKKLKKSCGTSFEVHLAISVVETIKINSYLFFEGFWWGLACWKCFLKLLNGKGRKNANEMKIFIIHSKDECVKFLILGDGVFLLYS